MPDGCWHWTGALTRSGYGRLRVQWPDRHEVAAHRNAYRIFRGAIPEGLEIDHLCRVRHCVNPTHMEAVTRAINVSRGLSPCNPHRSLKHRTSCKRGHPNVPENHFIFKGKHVSCRLCRELTHGAWVKKRRATDASYLARGKAYAAHYYKTRVRDRLANDPTLRAKFNAYARKYRLARRLKQEIA